MVQEWWLVVGGVVVGMGAVIAVMDFIGCVRRRRCHRRPGLRGQVKLFDEVDGHVISATLSADGLETLVRDVRRGRFG
jgi:hypothetical protein